MATHARAAPSHEFVEQLSPVLLKFIWVESMGMISNSRRSLQFLVVLAATLLIVLAAGCGRGLASSGNNAVDTSSSSSKPGSTITITASANPTTIAAGQSSTITWTTTNATAVSIDNGVGAQAANGHVTVSPQQTTTYTLTASANGATSVTTQVTVTVSSTGQQPDPNAPQVTLLASPEAITVGQSATLIVSSQNAASVTIDNGVGAATPNQNQQFTVKPQTTTTYTATATSASGATATSPVTVNVFQPGAQPQITFSANPPVIQPGGQATLTWNVQQANNVSIDNGIGPVPLSGNTVVKPTQTTTYTLSASNAQGTLTSQQTVAVQAGQMQISFVANPPSIAPGGTSNLSWSVTGATSVTIDNGIGQVNAQDNRNVSPLSTTTYTLTATDANNNTKTATAEVTVGSGGAQVSGWLTYKYDGFRTGANTTETVLTPANVNPNTFGKKATITLDANIYAQPLYVRAVNVAGQGVHNIVIYCTEKNSIYAFDAQSMAQLWKVNLGTPAGNNQAGRTDLGPTVGITGTPVIDPNTGIMYVSSMTVNASGVESHHLHAIDITNGQDKMPPAEIKGSVTGTGKSSVNGQITFTPKLQNQRSGLALANGIVYVPFGSFSDQNDTANGLYYHGWIFAYDAATLNQIGIWNASPDGEGTSIWMAGNAPAIDADGRIYVETADGDGFNANVGGSNYGDSFVKLGFLNGKLSVLDWFTPYNEQCLDTDDLDLGGGGPMLVPDALSGAHANVLVGGSKEGRMYVLDRNSMGGFDATGATQTSNPQIVQDILWNPRPCKSGDPDFDANSPYRMYSAPGYWNGNVYQAAAFNPMKAYHLGQDGLLTQTSQSTVKFAASGQSGRAPIPVISANGTTNGIVWGQHRLPQYPSTDPNSANSGQTTLYAFDATDVSKLLWSSDMNAARDKIGVGSVFITPMVMDGRVYTSASNRVIVYGLLQ